jgi:hypothetical protein
MKPLNLSEWALNHRSLVVYLMIVAVAAGVLSYFRLGRDEDPSFIIKTMVVKAVWPGATTEETLNQITERLERTLEETPHLDFLRSFTTPSATTIFVNLKGSTSAQQVADTWYHVRKSIADMRHALPSGVRGPFFNDEFGDTFGIIYGFTADGFTPRELRDYVETPARNSSACRMYPDRDPGAQDEQIFIVLGAGARQSKHRPRRIDRRSAGVKHRPSRRCHSDGQQVRFNESFGRLQLRTGHIQRQLRNRRANASLERHRPHPPGLCRPSTAAIQGERQACDRPRHRHARRRRYSRPRLQRDKEIRR